MNTVGCVSHIYFSQRLRLHYVEWPCQQASKGNMVLVHGIQDHCRTWDDVVNRFQADFRIIAPDLRGHGDSEWVTGSAYQYLDYVYDLHQLIQQAKLAPVTLVGHSMGGAIAALFAGIFPAMVEKLIVIEGIGLWSDAMPQTDPGTSIREWVGNTHALSARQPRRYASLEMAYRRMQEANPQLTEAQAMHLTAHGSNQNEDGTYSWKYDNYIFNFSSSSVDSEVIKTLWSAIDCPVLLINAENGLEHRIGHGDTLQYFADVRLTELPDVGHWTYHDDLEGVVDCMYPFLCAQG
ncbi:MAG: alpha/beta hydrolase [Pseudomonadota bacterium]